MFSLSVNTVVFIGNVSHNAVHRSVTCFTTETASCHVSAVGCHMSKCMALVALSRLGVAFEKFTVVSLIAPVDFLSNHLICVFWFSDTNKEGACGFFA